LFSMTASMLMSVAPASCCAGRSVRSMLERVRPKPLAPRSWSDFANLTGGGKRAGGYRQEKKIERGVRRDLRGRGRRRRHSRGARLQRLRQVTGECGPLVRRVLFWTGRAEVVTIRMGGSRRALQSCRAGRGGVGGWAVRTQGYGEGAGWGRNRTGECRV
jgi:hypothetical protein